MSQFVVSARKYRPQRFDEVVGQEHVSKTLKNALQNDQLAHAFLFCGPRGVGKTTCARILAKVLNCQNRADDFEACNTCNACKAFNDNASFNINELDAASNNSVEHIRALIEQVRFQPQQGQYKIFIIDEVHMLSQQAFNAFLKTLEEPPAYAIFILATTEKHKIIPTILSRCQIFDFKRIQIPRIVSHLQHICKEEGIQADKEALHIIAQKADGALRDGLSIFDRMTSFSGGTITYDSVIENLNVLDYDYYFKVVEAMVTEDLSRVLLIFDEIFKKGFDPDIFINGLAEHLRNLLVCKDPKTLELLDLSDGLKKQYQTQAKMVPSSFILTALNIATDCDINYKMARHKRLHVEMAIIKMTYIGRAVALSQQPVTPAAIEKKKIDPKDLEKKPLPVATLATSTISHKEALPSTNDTPAQEPTRVSEPALEEIKPELSVDAQAKSTTEPPIPVAHQTAEVIPKEDSSSIQEQIKPEKTPEITQEEATKPVQKSLDTSNQTPVVATSLKHKKTKFDLPSLTDITEIEEEKLVVYEKVILEMPPLKKAWEEFITQIESPSVQQSFKAANLKVKDELTIEVEVRSQMSKSLIQQEKDLIPYLRKTLRIPNIALEIAIDPEKVKEFIQTKKILSNREKYELMREKNPLVQDLSVRLGLKPDND